MKKKFYAFTIALLAGLMACTTIVAQVSYVKAGGTGGGTSWADASGDMQAVVNASTAGNQVWVAAGTYKPTSGTDRTITFAMKTDVKIYGKLQQGHKTAVSGFGRGKLFSELQQGHKIFHH